MSSDDLKAEEEAKRERNWDPVERWKVIQRTIAWADAQRDPPRNSPRGCQEAQRRMLEIMGELPASAKNPPE